jgi:hypothetical protein
MSGIGFPWQFESPGALPCRLSTLCMAYLHPLAVGHALGHTAPGSLEPMPAACCSLQALRALRRRPHSRWP